MHEGQIITRYVEAQRDGVALTYDDLGIRTVSSGKQVARFQPGDAAWRIAKTKEERAKASRDLRDGVKVTASDGIVYVPIRDVCGPTNDINDSCGGKYMTPADIRDEEDGGEGILGRRR